MKRQTAKVIAILLVLSVFVSGGTSVSAATVMEEISPHASVYLSSYSAWTSIDSDNKIYVYYDVDATDTVARIGAKLIVLQVKDAGVWTNVLTKTGTVTNGMLLQNKASHLGAITYQGTEGKTYRAVVTVYAGPASGGDSRIITTNSVP